LTEIIMNVLLKGGGLTKEELSKKLLWFGIDGVNVLQGRKTWTTKQIKNSWAPFFMGVHCIAHRANLAIPLFGEFDSHC
jgi:hypothetical protein